MTKTTIYVNGRFLKASVTGVQRYAYELLRTIDRLIGRDDPAVRGYEFIVLAPPGEIHELGTRHIEVRQGGRMKGQLWEQISLPQLSKDGFLLNLCNAAPLLKRRQAVTLHDAAVYSVPDTYSTAFKMWYKLMFRTLGKTAPLILTCSTNSKNELIEHCGIREDKIRVVYHGKEHVLQTGTAPDFPERKGLARPFVLAVSSQSPNKNFRSIVRAAELIGDSGYDFVIAGGTNPKIFKSAEAELGDNVKHVGYVEDEELRTLYEEAACFVFPSFYEGFGFPPLEAMACGCPVVVSDTASLPEVCGDAVLYCDPSSPEDIAAKIDRVMGDPALREDMRRRGLAQADRFSWEKCALETLAELKPQVSGREPRSAQSREGRKAQA
ncbi:glycosyltransferase family 1 protein [Saccharibacillus sp. CPCC 101409]|uniref:glycosyltransferase family 4 protein n=1 Tax=Saccharibacillus sp. CPCC 101409 TaxID=3058041 RepID=UPI00267179A5|nr:glycosyltransferase family 1 protein [Saccharibacillus sp. CPCC 101409]MDO3411676.1 glycosyltransferase family 1 protein [Saccharibacillus sp. CPCC 101409]